MSFAILFITTNLLHNSGQGTSWLHIERPRPPLEALVAEEHLECLKLYLQAVAAGPCQSEEAMAVALRVPQHFLTGVSSNVAVFHAVVAS